MTRSPQTATASVPAAASGTELRFLALYFDLSTLRTVPHGLPPTPLELKLDEWLAMLARRPAAGFITVCYAATGTWAELGQDADFLHRITPLKESFDPLASAVIRHRRDSPGDGTKPVRDDSGGKLWLRFFFDNDLASSYEKSHNYELMINSIAGKRLSDEPPLHASKQQEYLDALLATVPKGAPYEVQATRLEGLISDVRQQAAARLLPALKDEMQRRPHVTYEQKIELVRWVNAELRRFDLAISVAKDRLSIDPTCPYGQSSRNRSLSVEERGR